MSAARTPTKAAPPVMLCRLCHCEFTNFKEHVKSLVHLDARETKSTPKPPIKHKSSDEDNKDVKKAKTGAVDEQASASENNDSKEKSAGNKESVPLDDKAQTLIPVVVVKDAPSSSEEDEVKPDVVDLNGTLKTGNQDVADKNTEAYEIKEYARTIGKTLKVKEKVLLNNHWHCKLCLHVHHLKDGSFDEHAHSEDHKVSVERRLNSLKSNYKWRQSCQWLMNCLACSFCTNDTAQFISHLQTQKHGKILKEIIESNKVVVTGEKPGSRNREIKEEKMEKQVNKPGSRNREIKEEKMEKQVNKPTEQSVTSNVPQKNTNSKPSARALPVQGDCTKQNNINSKPFTPEANQNTPKITSVKPSYEKSQGRSDTSRNVSQNIPAKSDPKPLMSLSLPGTLKQNKPVWKSTSTDMRNQSSNRPGILGEYRPALSQNNFGFGGVKRDDFFVRPDKSSHTGLGFGRPTYSELSRDPLAATTQARTFELDSHRNVLGSEGFNTVWSGQSSHTSPTEKLNSIAFGRIKQKSPSGQFDGLSNLLSAQGTGTLPSNVSLDLASNSSIRFKYSSDRSAMFDSYPAPRLDLSRNNSSRKDLSRTTSRQDFSRPDSYSRSMFSRR